MSNKNHAVTQSEQNNSFLALGGRGVGTLVEAVKNEPCETACRMAEGGGAKRTLPLLLPKS